MVVGEVIDAQGWVLLASSRRAVLGTLTRDGRARLVPVCYWIAARPDAAGHPLLYTPLDEKPKRVRDPLRLARARDVLGRPQVTLLVDRWDEDWSRLAWLRLEGTAQLLPPAPAGGTETAERTAAVAGLRERYPQYATQDLQARPLVRVTVTRSVAWSAGNR